jgi:hypothetical protein
MMAQQLRDGNFGFALCAGVAELADAQDFKLAESSENVRRVEGRFRRSVAADLFEDRPRRAIVS